MIRPRIHWFSPLPPARSGIATHYAVPVIAELARRSDLTLWCDQEVWDPGLEAHAPVRRFWGQNVEPHDFGEGAINIYHLGNNTEFHRSIFSVAQRFPGVAVVHDPGLVDFFAALFWHHGAHRSEFAQWAETAHGTKARLAAEAFCGNAYSIHEFASRFPMTGAALSAAFGVVVHSRAAFRALSSMERWPVQYLPLAHPQYDVGAGPRRAPDGKLRLLMAGYIGPNRCLQEILEAIASYPRRDRLSLDVYGQLWEGNRIGETLDRLGLRETVRLHGYVSDRELDEALRAADLAINLRYPSVGEASASQMRFWQHALPTLNSPLEWYAEQPEGTMGYVRPSLETLDLHRHFDAFLENPTDYLAMGEAGRSLYLREHRPDVYAQRLLDFCVHARAFRKKAALLHVTRDLLPHLAALASC